MALYGCSIDVASDPITEAITSIDIFKRHLEVPEQPTEPEFVLSLATE